jgi:predicted transcriptional regulator
MKPITRAISIKQPFVEKILCGTKSYEDRRVRTNISERIYIYASLKLRSDKKLGMVWISPLMIFWRPQF